MRRSPRKESRLRTTKAKRITTSQARKAGRMTKAILFMHAEPVIWTNPTPIRRTRTTRQARNGGLIECKINNHRRLSLDQQRSHLPQNRPAQTQADLGCVLMLDWAAIRAGKSTKNERGTCNIYDLHKRAVCIAAN